MVVARKYRSGAELRRKPRRQFNYSAVIIADERKGQPVVLCSISDISDNGARIVLERDRELPEQFWLLLTSKGDARRRCRLIWRRGTTVGVAFPDAGS